MADAPGPVSAAMLARAARAAGHLHRAAAVIGDATRRWSDAPEVLIEAGYVSLSQGRIREARADSAGAVRSTPASVAGRTGLLLVAAVADGPAPAQHSLARWRAGAPDDVSPVILSGAARVVPFHASRPEKVRTRCRRSVDTG